MSGSGFANDGSFLERFKKMQEGMASEPEQPVSVSSVKPSAGTYGSSMGTGSASLSTGGKTGTQKSAVPGGGTKLAFGFKQKAKPVVNPLFKTGDDDEENVGKDNGKRRKADGGGVASANASQRISGAPPLPSDPEVQKVADKLAVFVAKNGRNLENITRQKNPGDTPFRFLFDDTSPEYKYYEWRISEEEKKLTSSGSHLPERPTAGLGAASRAASHQSAQRPSEPTQYQTSSAALYAGAAADVEPSVPPPPSEAVAATIVPPVPATTRTQTTTDSLAMMDYFMQKAAREARKRPQWERDESPPKQHKSKQEQQQPTEEKPSKRGHHMGDFIPDEELNKFMAKATGGSGSGSGDDNRIQSDNVGHRLLQKMGWTEGQGLGNHGSGRAEPVQAGGVKQNHLGVGAQVPGEVNEEDDIYEQYKKRMMLGYKHRPNPLGNPRKAYY